MNRLEPLFVNLAKNTLTTKGEQISMSQSPAKYHNLNRPDEVTDATSYKKHASKKLSIVPKIKELMMKWNKAISREKLMAIMAFLVVFLMVLAVCFVLKFEISTTGKEGR